MKRMRSESGVFEGDLRTQTLDSHEKEWELVGRKGLVYVHASQRVKISYNW